MRKSINSLLDVRNDRKMIYVDSYKFSQLPTEGLVAYYPFNGNADDESGNGNDGTVNGATFDSGEGKNGAYIFDGNDYINIDTVIDDLAATTQGSWCAWVKPVSATPSNANMIFGFGDTNVNEKIYLYHGAGVSGGRLTLTITDAGINQLVVQTNSNPFLDNVWVHVTIVQNGTEPILYVNGVAVAQTFTISTDKTSWFFELTGIDTGRIGDVNFNNGGEQLYYNGAIDEVMIYNRSLSEEEILQIYNANKSAFGH